MVGGVAGFVTVLIGVCVVALVAVITRARVEIARINAQSGRRGADVRL